MLGINDIGWPDSPLAPHEQAPSADDIIEGYKQLIARAHVHNMRIIGATLTPFEDALKACSLRATITRIRSRSGKPSTVGSAAAARLMASSTSTQRLGTRTVLLTYYSIRGLEDSFAIERKSIDDLANCCLGSNRERFEHELHRLRGYRFKRLLVVGSREVIATGRYHSRIAPKAVLATLGAFEVRYDLPVVFAETTESAALQVERWVWWFCREVVEEANMLLRGCSG
jgi:hypothetical protein